MIVVVGLAFEARIAAGPGVRVICSGDGRNLVSSLAKAIKETRLRKMDCGGLISFGVAGGLDPELQPGTCVVGSTILCGETRTATDPVWSQRLLRKIPEAVHGPLMGVSAPVARPEDKRVLYEQTGAVAVDMESHIVASLARKHEIPMAAIRVITDPAERALPACAVSAMRPNGTTDILAMIRSVMARPRELPALLQTALDARAARSTLMRGRKLLGPGLGLPDFRAAELAPQ
ncbi:MAG TPA: phosphorylase [Rhodoplanes sp.]|nr:phosphorylase [Rhodoplanes sp.]